MRGVLEWIERQIELKSFENVGLFVWHRGGVPGAAILPPFNNHFGVLLVLRTAICICCPPGIGTLPLGSLVA